MKSLLAAFVLLIFLISLSACFALPVEDPVPPPPVAELPAPRVANTTMAIRTDVARYFNTRAFLVPTREEQLFFPVSGAMVDGIFVSTGDFVQAGDIIASLYDPMLLLEYNAGALPAEAFLLQAIDHAERRRRHAQASPLSTAEDVARYRAEANRFRRELETVNMQLDFLREQIEELHVRATIDGIITRAITHSPGMQSSNLTAVAVVSDQTQWVFEVRARDAAEYMQIGQHFSIAIDEGEFAAIVVDPEDIGVERGQVQGHEVFLVLLDDAADLPENPIAHIHVEAHVARDVIALPRRVIHSAGGNYFVYVQNQLGIRAVRNIEVGLWGNTTVEIVSGIEAGELIIVD
jgi:multidrug efflux pump subunit AcrA (membrane-fusion protein)